MQPGETIHPGSPAPANPTPEPSAQVPQSAEPAQSQWQYNQEADRVAARHDRSMPPDVALSWTASEFINHHKNASWYGLLGLGVVVLSALVFLLTRDAISVATIMAAGLALAVLAGRKPRTVNYRLDEVGLTVGPKLYSYSSFKSFSIIDEGPITSVSLMPLRRFMPPMTIYYEPKDEEQILGVLTNYLPYEEKSADLVDQLMRKIRF